VRKTVTVVFSDVVGFTALSETLDAESVRQVMSLYFDEMRRVIGRHGGMVEKFIGDALMAVFGVPELHEDDALRAARAAAQMRAALSDLNEQLRASWGITIASRIGVNTGEVVTEESPVAQRLATGDAVNVAARLEQSATPGEIFLGETTYRLVRDAVVADSVPPLTVKGKSSPLLAWRLHDVKPEAPGLQRPLDAPIVARESELEVLSRSFAQSQKQACRLVTVVAPAGLGKSRLTREFTRGIAGQARVTYGRCLSYGDGVTYWPIAEIMRDLAGLALTDDPGQARARFLTLIGGQNGSHPVSGSPNGGPDGGARREDTRREALRIADVVAGAIGLSEAVAATAEIAWAVRRLLEIVAGTHGPLVVVLDDIHWAEPALLDLIEHVVMLARDVPLLVICMARPELDEVAPGWCANVRDAVRVIPGPLGAREVNDLLDHLLDGLQLPGVIRARIVAASEGNPLFVEEFLRMLVDNGMIVRSADRWLATAELGDLVVPASVQAILASRLERLNPEERAVLQRAAVVGREFYRDALEHLAADGTWLQTEQHLRSLASKQLVRPVAPELGGSDTFQFSHLLVRDVAYGSIPKAMRAELHEHFADWLEARAGLRAAEYEEIIGYHLEQAVEQLRLLGRVELRSGPLGVRAGQWLSAAGRRALARDDMSAAANLLTRAVEMLAPTDPEYPGLLRDLAAALISRGKLDEGERLLERAQESARAADDLALAELARLDQHLLLLQTRPEAALEALARATDNAYVSFTETANDAGLAHVWRLRAELDWMACSYGSTTQALEQALAHACRAGDTREESAITVWLASCLALGPTPATEAVARCHELLTQMRGSRRVEAAVCTVLGYLTAMSGSPDPAREFIRRGRQRHEELGLSFSRAHWTVFSGMALLLVGDTADAEAELRWGYQTLRDMGERAGLSTVAAYLARALTAQGRFDEAQELTLESEQAAALSDLASQIAWRGTRVLCRLAAGDPASAEEISRAAVALAEGTDDLELKGFAHAGLAAVLTAVDEPRAAAAEREAAAAAYLAKGDVVSANWLHTGGWAR
jgi:predicted ATPase/class 3 adenylate cyclase